MIEAYEYTFEQVRSDCPEAVAAALFRLYSAYFTILVRMLLMPDYKDFEEYPIVIGYLKQNWKKIFHCIISIKSVKFLYLF